MTVLRIRWFVERLDDDGTAWEFLDGDVPLVRQRRSPLLYSGNDPSIQRALQLSVPNRASGLPTDISAIVRASEQVQSAVATMHSWRTIEELVDLPSHDAELFAVLEAMLRVNAQRSVYWFEPAQ